MSNILCPNEKFYSIIQDINLQGQYVHAIDENLKSVTFNVYDTCKRDHFLHIFIHNEYSITKKQPIHFETLVPPVIMDSLLKVNHFLIVFIITKSSSEHI